MQLQLGQGRILKYTFSQRDFNRTAALSGDDNPIHVNPEFAAKTRFGKTVAHGVLLYGMICRALGTLIPGGMPLEQELIFPGPTYTDEELIVWVVVTGLQPEHKLAELDTYIIKQDGSLGLKGRAVVRLPQSD